MSFGVTLGLVLILFALKLLLIAAFINHKNHAELAVGAFVAGVLFVIIGVGILAGHLVPPRAGSLLLLRLCISGFTIAGLVMWWAASETESPARCSRHALGFGAAAIFFTALYLTIHLRS